MVIQTQDLIGHTFLPPPHDDGQQLRARIVQAIEDHEYTTHEHPENTHFRSSVNNDQYEEIMS